MQRRQEILNALQAVRERMVNFVSGAIEFSAGSRSIRLVAVSKRKPAQDVRLAYEAGQRHFGENYVQELVEKSRELPSDIQWHFLGHLQSNKCKLLASVPNLYAVETIDSCEKATAMNKAWGAASIGENRSPSPLSVFLQVNTSQEEAKHGVSPEQCTAVAQYVLQNCPSLRLIGLMTIGSVEHSQRAGAENPDFRTLVACKQEIERNFPSLNLELSMGMSADFEAAIRAGSTNIRVGSTIFGERDGADTKS